MKLQEILHHRGCRTKHLNPVLVQVLCQGGQPLLVAWYIQATPIEQCCEHFPDTGIKGVRGIERALEAGCIPKPGGTLQNCCGQSQMLYHHAFGDSRTAGP